METMETMEIEIEGTEEKELFYNSCILKILLNLDIFVTNKYMKRNNLLQSKRFVQTIG